MYQNIFHIVFVATYLSVVGDSENSNSELDEGSKCHLGNGEFGICKKIVDCPSKLEEVKEGKRSASSIEDRCGFVDFTEIVCCSGKINRKRKTDLACEYYKSLNKPIWLGPPPVIFLYGGVDASNNEFPFMAALGYPNKNKNETAIIYDCGGSLISMKHVLTASHCASNVHGRVPVEVLLGTRNIANVTTNAQRIQISNIIKHPDYRLTKSYNDIAILELRTKIQYTFAVKPACLYTEPLITVNKHLKFVVAGWGITDLYSDKASKLQKSPFLGMVSREECNKHYTNFWKLPNGIIDTLVCTIDSNSSRRGDACKGDSGGPLLTLHKSDIVVAGVIVLGGPCGSYAPGVSTSVYPFLDWIEEIVWPNNTW